MEEEQAIAVARALGGDVWQSGGDIVSDPGAPTDSLP